MTQYQKGVPLINAVRPFLLRSFINGDENSFENPL